MTPTILLHGTWGLDDLWWRPGSAFAREAERHGVHLPAGWPPFKWSGALGGLPTVGAPADPSGRFPEPQLAPWEVAGYHLALYARLVGGGGPVNLLTHSHGLQVGAFAAVYAADLGVRIEVFLSISGPIRRDMQRVRRAAMDNIGRWIQVADHENDKTIRQGEFLDGAVGWVYELPEPGTVNVRASYGHSGLFEERNFPAWEALSLWTYFATPEVI